MVFSQSNDERRNISKSNHDRASSNATLEQTKRFFSLKKLSYTLEKLATTQVKKEEDEFIKLK